MINERQMTDYHAKYFSYELIKKSSSNNIEKLTQVISDAKIDAKPHQIEAALFAFRSPLSNGAILADEVGLGKTIEAGLVISQKWVEKKRKILIITPATLRKQWYEELSQKFYLNPILLESKSFNEYIKKGMFNPFQQENIIIASYNFISNKEVYVKNVDWDLVVIDEAHRLRNVYKSSNKISKSIKTAIEKSPKLLLTATPLQNSLLELYGLTSFIDEYIFGDLSSFKNQFSKISEEDNSTFIDLKNRIKPICQRTLRKQVLEYINYTNRLSITQEFYPSDKEQKLYDDITEYLQRDNLKALPPSQRLLMTLILRKLLASSSFAIAGTLRGLINKLNIMLENSKLSVDEVYNQLNDYTEFDDLADEDEEFDSSKEISLTEKDIEIIKKEIDDLTKYAKLAEEIKQNSKGEVLLTALDKGFKEMKKIGAPEKALIFTESKRTQEYIYSILQNTEYKDQIVFYNGTNTDKLSKNIYEKWIEKHKGKNIVTGSISADKRSALIEYFKNDAKIMIATEAAAEGVNLQFCSMVVNYDLPWNPQRVEQRIGRCHRYGQKYDVVVINFLNKRNAADIRVYELLKEKFKLFDGVFGASDDVLGVIESGVDFEKRINTIYQSCRRTEEIKEAFDNLQKELEEQINERMKATSMKLFENFDEEVTEKLKISLSMSRENLNKYEQFLMDITKYKLENEYAKFYDNDTFEIFKSPYKLETKLGKYQFKHDILEDEIQNYRIGHLLAQNILKEYLNKDLPIVKIVFDYSGSNKNINIIKDLVGKSGELNVKYVNIDTFETEDYIVLNGITSDGITLDVEQCKRLFSIEKIKKVDSSKLKYTKELDEIFEIQLTNILDKISQTNSDFFENEIEKLEKWSEDVKKSLELELRNLDIDIKLKKAESRKLLKLEQKLDMQKNIKKLESRRNELRKNIYEEQDKIEHKKDNLINKIEKRMKQKVNKKEIFTIQWEVI